MKTVIKHDIANNGWSLTAAGQHLVIESDPPPVAAIRLKSIAGQIASILRKPVPVFVFADAETKRAIEPELKCLGANIG